MGMVVFQKKCCLQTGSQVSRWTIYAPLSCGPWGQGSLNSIRSSKREWFPAYCVMSWPKNWTLAPGKCVQGVRERWLDSLRARITFLLAILRKEAEHISLLRKTQGFPPVLYNDPNLISAEQDLISMGKGSPSWNTAKGGKKTKGDPWKICPTRIRNPWKEDNWENLLPKAQVSQKMTSEKVEFVSQSL